MAGMSDDETDWAAAELLLTGMIGKLHELVEIGAVVAAATWVARGDLCTLTVGSDGTTVRFGDGEPVPVPRAG